MRYRKIPKHCFSQAGVSGWKLGKWCRARSVGKIRNNLRKCIFKINQPPRLNPKLNEVMERFPLSLMDLEPHPGVPVSIRVYASLMHMQTLLCLKNLRAN